MTKRIENVIPDSQQKIRTKIEKEDDELIVKIRACSKLDTELKSEFKEKIRDLGTEQIAVRVQTYRTNQGNENGQDVTIRFPVDEQLKAVDIVDNVIQIGKEYYDRQLERNLGSDDDIRSESASKNQQKYFDDQDIKEFCLLYRGKVNF